MGMIIEQVETELSMEQEPTMTVLSDGSHRWFLRGWLHREDGPAVEGADGTRRWYINGQLHRTDGPAIEWRDGTRQWYINGKYHRTDGPAIEWADGTCEWCINGIRLSFRSWLDSVDRTEEERVALRLKWR
jgi:hypothetical protein